LNDIPDPCVVLVRTQWLASPTPVLKSQVDKHIKLYHDLYYKSGTKALESCSSANSSKGGPKFKRVRQTLEPTATDWALANTAKSVLTGQIEALSRGSSASISELRTFSLEDRSQILRSKESWASKGLRSIPPIPRLLKREVGKLVELGFEAC
jgi:hypothetical protein